MSLSEREELHHLAREVLVGSLAAAAGVVEIDEHRRVLRDRVKERREVAERLAPQQRVLAIHELAQADLLLARREMVVPEDGHALGERTGGLQHLAQPPGAKLEPLLDEAAQRGHALLGAHLPQAIVRLEGRVDESRRREDAIRAARPPAGAPRPRRARARRTRAPRRRSRRIPRGREDGARLRSRSARRARRSRREGMRLRRRFSWTRAPRADTGPRGGDAHSRGPPRSFARVPRCRRYFGPRSAGRLHLLAS